MIHYDCINHQPFSVMFSFWGAMVASGAGLLHHVHWTWTQIRKRPVAFRCFVDGPKAHHGLTEWRAVFRAGIVHKQHIITAGCIRSCFARLYRLPAVSQLMWDPVLSNPPMHLNVDRQLLSWQEWIWFINVDLFLSCLHVSIIYINTLPLLYVYITFCV